MTKNPRLNTVLPSALPTAMSGASAHATAETPVMSSGKEVAVDNKISPTHEADMPVFSAIMSP